MSGKLFLKLKLFNPPLSSTSKRLFHQINSSKIPLAIVFPATLWMLTMSATDAVILAPPATQPDASPAGEIENTSMGETKRYPSASAPPTPLTTLQNPSFAPTASFPTSQPNWIIISSE